MNNEDLMTQDVFENLQELLEHNEIREFREAFWITIFMIRRNFIWILQMTSV
jgi:hypothetical protein